MKTSEKSKTVTISNTSKNVLRSHLSSFLENDLAAVMSDYTDESILITQEKTYKGLQEIKLFFAGLITHFPNQKSSFDLDKLVVYDDFAYIVWHAKTPSIEVPLATDTYIINEGKIYRQTFTGQIIFL